MSQEDSATTAASAGIPRRTIVKGAAWSIPVIAVAVAAPQATASVVDCPALPQPSAWTMTTAGSLSSSGTTGGTSTQFVSQKDANINTGDGEVDFTTVIPVVAGQTYTLTFQIEANYANGGGVNPTSAQGLDVFAGSELLYHAWTRPRTGFETIPTAGPQTITLTFTASATQNLPLRFSFGLQPRNTADNAGNDDVYVTSPTLLCN